MELYKTLTHFNFYSAECALVSAFDFLFGIPIGITSSTVRLRLCAINEWSKKYKTVIKCEK